MTMLNVETNKDEHKDSQMLFEIEDIILRAEV